MIKISPNQFQNIKIFKNLQALSLHAATLFYSHYQEAINKYNRFSVVLSGGSTPNILYQNLIENYGTIIDWSKVHFFWGDERNVQPDDQQSNFGNAKKYLINLLPTTPNVYRIEGDLDTNIAAKEYELQILDYFEDNPPSFDLIYLGVGLDGHIASLFPNTQAIKNHQNLVVENYVEALNSHRITMTFKTINLSRNIIVLANGITKAEIIGKIFTNPKLNLPAQKINPIIGTTTWLLDNHAATNLYKDN
jgi:6-phosphogluconolactonase